MKIKGLKIHILGIIVCSIILVFIVFIYTYIFFFGRNTLSEYKYKVYPNTYIAKNDISGMNDKELSAYVNTLENDIKNIKLNINIDNKNYNYTLDDLGVYINKDEIIKNVLNNDYNKDLYASIKRLAKGEDDYSYKIIYSDTNVKDFVNNLKKQVDIEALSGSLQINGEKQVSYEGSKVGYTLDKEKVVEQVKNEIYKNLKNADIENVDVINIKAVGRKVDTSSRELKSINTKISSFSTKYYDNNNGSVNLKKAVQYVDKVVVMPGEEFSFFDYVGPYDKEGYVVFDDLIGNGVCQVSTTLYNAIMLAGIQATDRSAHTEKPEYAMGGMDSMVASVDGHSSTDFKFKNTLDYPIYISAYLEDGSLIVDLWSNDQALGDKSYEVESVSLSATTYDIYLYTYSGNQIISKQYLYRDSYKK